LSCSYTPPSIGDIGSSRQNFSEFCLSPSLQAIKTPSIGDIGSSHQNFSEFCLSPSLQAIKNPSIGDIGSSHQNFSEFCLSPSLQAIKTPSIGDIGSSRQNFSEFCLSPPWRFENRSFQRLFLLFEIPVKMKKVRNYQPIPRFCPWPQSLAAGSWRGKCRAQWEDLDGTCGRRIEHDELG